MRPYTELTAAGQFRRMRRAAWAALERYGVRRAPAHRLSPLVHGENTTFRLRLPAHHPLARRTSCADFVVRVHRLHYQTRDSIRSELAWTRAIERDLGVRTPRAVCDEVGGRVQEVEVEGVPGRRFAVVFRWLDGRFRTRSLRPAEVARMGALMGRLHTHSETWERPDGFTRLEWREDAMLPDDMLWRGLLEALDASRARRLEAARAGLYDWLKAWGVEPSRSGLVHADLHAWNVLHHREGLRVLDFDDAGTAYWMQDVATATMGLRGSAALLDAFREGYRGARALSDEDWETLPHFTTARELFELRWVAERRDNPNVGRWLERTLMRCDKAAHAWLVDR